MVRKALFISAILFIIHCGISRPDDDFVINEVFSEGGRKNPIIINRYEINLDEDPFEEFVYLIRNGSEESLVIFKKDTGGSFVKIFQRNFIFTNIGPYQYDTVKKAWRPIKISRNSKTELYIIKNFEFINLPGDSFSSLLFEVLVDEPPLDIYSIPFIFRKNEIAMNGFEVFKEKGLIHKYRRIPYTLNSSGAIIFFPGEKEEIYPRPPQ